MHYTAFQDTLSLREMYLVQSCINSALEKKMNKSISIEKRSSDSPVSSYYILSQKTTQWILAKSLEMKY